MSWSVSGSGTPSEVRGQLSAQFKSPLADGTAGLANADEKQTVQMVFDLCEYILTTFDPIGKVQITASGHMVVGSYQEVSLKVTPLA